MDSLKKNKKSVTWGGKTLFDREIATIKNAISSGDSKKLHTALNSSIANLDFKEGILRYLKYEKKGFQALALQVFFEEFGTNADDEGYYNMNKEDFCKLLSFLFEKVGIDVTKNAFLEVEQSFIKGGFSGFLPEILSDFNKIALEFNIQQHSSSTSTTTTEYSAEAKEEGRSNIQEQVKNTNNSSASSENITNQRSIVGPATEKFEYQVEIKKKIPQEDILVSVNNKDKNSNSVDTNKHSEQKNASSLYDLANDISWFKDLPRSIQKMFRHYLEDIYESKKYIKETLDIKSSDQDLFNDNQDNSLSSSN